MSRLLLSCSWTGSHSQLGGGGVQHVHHSPTPATGGASCAAPSECGKGVHKPLQVLVVGGHGLLWVADLPNLVMQAVPLLFGLLLVAVWAIHG